MITLDIVSTHAKLDRVRYICLMTDVEILEESDKPACVKLVGQVRETDLDYAIDSLIGVAHHVKARKP